MDLNLNNKTFLVSGVSSGFGKATAEHLIQEGAHVIGVARTQSKLDEFASKYRDKLTSICGDISQSETVQKVAKLCIEKDIAGAFINAGGPPAKLFEETELEDWDNAYKNLLRWKVELTQALLPHFKAKQYGRIVYLESASVKQPIENLVLSTSLRLSVVGMMKTLSQELAGHGITFNMIAPGSHATPAIDRLIQKSAEQQGVDFKDAKSAFIDKQPSKKMGTPEGLGSLAAWLLSDYSEFVNGQVYAIEGGTVKGTL
ncbi:SDR family oxidoreductase [Labilibacter marinus]|uniref:SDR family oxidoreductase n=1 Tax=Labilibacter marinus TaxID=1477105 RepID=UPI00094FB6FE|nr:SDR family oxidoreductase [Labilibacter marinus]